MFKTVSKGGPRLADASGYIPFIGDWKAYVATMNAEAERWIKGHRLGENHGYILSSASEKEFASLHHAPV
jgi:hypothetical protein